MNKELFREEIIYSVGDSNLEENSYEMIKDVIRNNHAVGFMTGHYDENLTITNVSGFLLYFRTEAISDRWFLWRFYHILHFGQRQSEFAERRFLWHIHLLCIHQHIAWTFGCIGRRISWRTI